ncbi:6649_t:CDS:1, partial [Cetraspora pellucida]
MSELPHGKADQEEREQASTSESSIKVASNEVSQESTEIPVRPQEPHDNSISQSSSSKAKRSKVICCGPSPNGITVFVELICLTITLIWIHKYNEIILPIESVFIHSIPYIVTYVISYSIADILNAIFNWFISKKIKDTDQYHDLMVAAANSQVLGFFTIIQRIMLIWKYRINKCLAFIMIFGLIAALTLLLSNITFAISTTPQIPGLMPIYSNSLNIDPLTPCGVGDASCPALLQDRFRFMWLQGASDVLLNGITKQLSVNWGDDPGGERKVMVAVVDNDTSINYKFVKDNKKSVPVFSFSTICNISTPPNFPGFRTPYHNLTMTDRINLTLAVEMDSWLENRWIAEVINLQQDDLNETTIMTVNLVKILSLNSKCEGISINTVKSKLCYPEIAKNITCYMNTHVENVESVSAGCKDDCPVIGFRFTNSARVNYSSPKPVYGDYMHKSLAIYGGNILIPQCIDNLVGCVNYNENNVSQVKDRFVELMYGITASGVMARRSLLSNNGTIVNVQSVVKGKAGVILKFEEGYYYTVVGLVVLCIVAY